SLGLDADGGFVYTPNADYFGPDAFTYRVADGHGANGDEGHVTIDVTPVNDAPTFTSTPTTQLTISLQGDAAQDRVFSAAGAAGTSPDVTYTILAKDASTKFEAGYYRVDDASGRIGTLKPGDAGYADAALAAGRAVTLFNSSSTVNTERHANLSTDSLY